MGQTIESEAMLPRRPLLSATAPTHPVLAGRVRETTSLVHCLDALLDGRGGLVLLGGSAGIGKTSLARELGQHAFPRGVLVATGRTFDLTTPAPYAVWSDLLGELANQPDVISRVPVPTIDAVGGETAETLHARLRAVLLAIAQDQPLLVILEDLHWSDQPSLDLLRVVAQSSVTAPLLIVATYRSDELALDHPLAQLLPTLVRETAALRLELRPLALDDITELLRAQLVLDAIDEARLATYLLQRSDGNPFFLHELLRDAIEEGRLTQQGDRWSLGDLGDLGVPRLLRQVVAGRLARFDTGTQQQLAIAAVIGQETTLELWSEVGGLAEDALIDLIDQCERAKVLESLPNGTGVRFAHALIADALYETILPPRRRIRHRRIAECIAAKPSPDPDIVAHHFSLAGDPRAATWLVRAAARARQVFAWDIAQVRSRAATEVLRQIPEPTREHGWLLYCTSDNTNQDPGQLLLQRELFRDVLRVAERVNDPLLEAYARLDLGQLEFLIGDSTFEHTRQEIEASIALFDRLPPECTPPEGAAPPYVLAAFRSSVISGGTGDEAWTLPPWGGRYSRDVLAQMLGWHGHFREAQAVGLQLLDQLRRPGEPEVPTLPCSGLYHTLGDAAAWLGAPDEARRYFDQSILARRATGATHMVGFGLAGKLEALLPYFADAVHERRQLAGTTIADIALGAPGVIARGMPAEQWIATSLLLDGDWDTVARAVAALDSRVGALSSEYNTLVRPAWSAIARHRGDAASSWQQVDMLLPGGPATPFGQARFQGAVHAQRTAVELALDAGDLTMARTWLTAHDQWYAASEAVLGDAERRLLWSRYYRGAGDDATAIAWAELALERATYPRQPLALLAAHRALGELAVAAGDHSSARSHLGAASTLADACAAPFERALCEVACAGLCLAEGDPAAARAALDTARAICERLGARPTLERIAQLEKRLHPRHNATTYPSGLSAREVEVLRLVAEGLGTSEVADRLYVSPRTVTTHLSSIYNKLGVSSRAAVTRFAIEHGLV